MAALPYIRHYVPDVAAGDAPHTTPANWVAHAYAGPQVRTQEEGANTGAANPRTHRDPINPGPGQSKQRLDPHAPVPAAELQGHRLRPQLKIPFSWWHTFLPNRFDKVVMGINPATGNPVVVGHNDYGLNKTTQHYPALDAMGDNIRAPTSSRITTAGGHHHAITANARPLLMYKRTNTLDTPANGPGAKRCAYGKIRDEETNSWRCIKNPNHHTESNMD